MAKDQAKEKEKPKAKKKALPPVTPRPYDPKNKHLSKADFIEKRKKEQEKAVKLAKLSKEIDDEGKKEAENKDKDKK